MDAVWSDASPQSPQGRKKRIRNWTTDDRARHKIEERTRREAFNQSLTDLALLLPSLANDARWSKHIVIQESLKHHREQQATLERLESNLERLVAERDELVAEVNHWRQSCGVERRQALVEPHVEHDTERPMGSADRQADAFEPFLAGFDANGTQPPQPTIAAQEPALPPASIERASRNHVNDLESSVVVPNDPGLSMAAPVPPIPSYSEDLFAPDLPAPEIDFDQLAAESAQPPATSNQQSWPLQEEFMDFGTWPHRNQPWTDYDPHWPRTMPGGIY